MTNQTDYDYYVWLVDQISIPNDRTYIYLFERMHNFEFLWTVPNDDNRIQDGKDLRTEFLYEFHGRLNLEWVSFLEVLIALSRRLAFTASGNPTTWAWKLIKNLRLAKMSDPLTDIQAQKIDEILNAVVWRTYDYNGDGGFFPLNYPAEDQTKVEIWYQLNAYVIEMHKF